MKLGPVPAHRICADCARPGPTLRTPDGRLWHEGCLAEMRKRLELRRRVRQQGEADALTERDYIRWGTERFSLR